MLIHRRECLLGGASLVALSLAGCNDPLPTLAIAGLGLAITVVLGPEYGVAVSIGSLLFDIVKEASIDLAAHTLEQTTIKFMDNQTDVKPVTKGEQINAATKDDEGRQFAYLAAQAQGEDDVIGALNNKIPIWLQSTNLKNYNSFKVMLKNTSNDSCVRGAEGDRVGGQVIVRIIDQDDGTDEVTFYTDPFCLDPGVEKLLDYSFVGQFSKPGRKRLEVVSRPANVDVKLSSEFLVVPLQAGDPPTEPNAIRPNESA